MGPGELLFLHMGARESKDERGNWKQTAGRHHGSQVKKRVCEESFILTCRCGTCAVTSAPRKQGR